MNIETVLKLFNEEKKSLKDIGSMFGVSKSTVQRFIVKHGYVYNPSSKLYEPPLIINDSVIDKQIKNTDNVSRETLNDETMANGSYTIPSSVARALKLKAVLEDKKAVDIVRKAIEDAIEPKYYNM